MVFAIALVLLVVGSVLFHLLSPWYLTPLASNWGNIDDTIGLTFWVTGFVFVAVNLFLAWCVIRYKKGDGHKADYEPENQKLEFWLTIVTSLGVAAMLAPGLLVWSNFVTVPEEATEIEAIGQQWHWSFRLPGEDNKLGTIDSSYITQDNPFGMNPDDPNGQDDVLIASNELHVPIGAPVKMLLRSNDVLHNFTVTEFRVKMDLVPGMVTYLWYTPTKVGEYDILCEEYCGVAHFAMRGRVTVEEEADYQTWLAAQPTYAETLAQPVGDAVAGAPAYAVCAACHGAQGEGNPQLNSPKISGQEGWYMKRQLEYFKSGARGAHEDDIFGKQMAPMAGTLVNDAAINNVVAYIESLPDTPAAPTVTGDVNHGQEVYETCAACHGPQAEGRWALNAPRLSGMTDWYLVTQLKNFREGIRGADRKDMYGHQMTMLAATLTEDQTIDDLVAYINTLP
jgi:cytochrome c oxidase subunit 2